MSQVLNIPIVLKRGLESNRLSVTPISGELLVTTDENKLFIGNGSTAGGVVLVDKVFTLAEKTKVGYISVSAAVNLDDVASKALSALQSTDIVNNLTEGGATKLLSAEQGKVLKGLVDGMASGLIYRGAFDAATETTLPADVKAGDFYKVSSVNANIDGLELAIGDMIIANKDKVGATTSSDWDKIDNTESPDILRTGDISADANFNNDTTKLASRATIAAYVTDVISALEVSPITTEGDIIVGNSSGKESRLALGNANTILGSNGTTVIYFSSIDGGTF